jgi:chaperonin cofactor prefoldin
MFQFIFSALIPTASSVIVLAADAPDPNQAVQSAGLDLNGLISGGTGASVVAALIFVGKLILDRAIPSRSDARANVTLVLEGLNNMVKVLQEEKLADTKRLEDKQARIDILERESDKDYDRISELRSEIIDLRNRLAVKDRHINNLVSELRKFGVMVTGIELDDADIEITHPSQEIQQARRAQPDTDSTPTTPSIGA